MPALFKATSRRLQVDIVCWTMAATSPLSATLGGWQSPLFRGRGAPECHSPSRGQTRASRVRHKPASLPVPTSFMMTRVLTPCFVFVVEMLLGSCKHCSDRTLADRRRNFRSWRQVFFNGIDCAESRMRVGASLELGLRSRHV
jgi:hypothetical protein